MESQPSLLLSVPAQAQTSDFSNSGRHFEQPLPIDSFTSRNIEDTKCTPVEDERQHKSRPNGSVTDLDSAFHKELRSESRECRESGSSTSNYSTTEEIDDDQK